ncbi:hypothetical protein DRH27_05465 [Candidatus Falkowbacteria bacterium]|nr:MAG: hypothetical protein DRH27_05465 [Candidatus Falkowbacteria bacterium]
MKYNRFLPLIVPLLTWLFLEAFFFNPKLLYIIFVLIFLLFFFTTRQFTLASQRGGKWWNYIILPFSFFSSLTIFSTMIPSKLLVQILFLINTIFLYYYFRSIFFNLIKESYYQKYSLENLSSYGNFLAVYFWASSLYGLQVFLSIQTWMLMAALLLIIALIVYEVMRANNIDLREGVIYILLICLVLTELAWSASFLTLSFYILGLVIAVCYYILIGLTRFYLLKRLNARLIKLYLIFGFSSLAIVLFTARWISN